MIPRPEYPRPQFQRHQWHNLNGDWRFLFDPENVGETLRWYMPENGDTSKLIYGSTHHGKVKPLRISVPYPWESPLSGVCRPDYKGGAWYEREFTVPAHWAGLNPVLNFGAVDWHARVWINGQFVAEHANGYLPFSIDLSPYVQPGETATVTVRAYDIADATTMLGKQVPRWYTCSSGIWQTVWLEARPANHITNLRVTPRIDTGDAHIQATVQIANVGEYRLAMQSTQDAFPARRETVWLEPGMHELQLIVSVPNPQLWSPESPTLYEFSAELSRAEEDVSDTVQSYFGMRAIGRATWNEHDFEYILLNGEPVYLRGALDQALHPDSLHAYPSDDVIRGDIQLAKDLGLNMLRCHIKVNDPRYYYWADKLGLLVMYDFPSPDLDTPEMRRMFEEAMPAIIDRDFNSPSIFAWVLFNETWGLTQHHLPHSHAWVAEVTNRARGLDPSRLIEDNSPCHYNHVDSDINSWHFYINDYEQVRAHIQRVVDETFAGSTFNYVGGEYVQTVAPLMNSEYGGIAARSGDQDIAWCFKYQTTQLRRHNKICGYVYTELDDIEWEHNGFVNYDRSAKEFGYDHFLAGMTVADLNGADFLGFDAPPCRSANPGEKIAIPLFASHWGAPMASTTVRWQAELLDRFAVTSQLAAGEIPVKLPRFAVTELPPLEIILPDQPGLLTITALLEDEYGTVRGRNYVHVEIVNDSPTKIEALGDQIVVPFVPGAYSASSWPRPQTDADLNKLAATGVGWVEYEIQLPQEVDLGGLSGLRLQFEAGARAGNTKIDWPERTYGFNYPQTETRKAPSAIAVSINGIFLETVHLPDDPADARGVLSHHHQVDPGSYGYLTEIIASSAQIDAVMAAGRQEHTLRVRFEVSADAEFRGGLALYGNTRGSVPAMPMLIVSTQKSL